MARIQCAGCRDRFEVDESQMGQVVPCPLCGFMLRLPALQIPPGTIIAGYRIEQMLAIGGMGEVYRATQLSMERQVALKLLSPTITTDKEALADFLREVRLLARLTHPNIVEAIEAGEDNGIYYLSMSFVDGETLENILKQGPMREREALEIAKTVAETLRYAWEKHRLLHRDVKPANIMLDKRGRVALMDLGIARIVEEGVGGRASVVHGSPQYMSPEQVNGHHDLDARADIYSLGATLYQLVCNRELFPGNDVDLILRQQLDEKPVPLRKINPNVSAACEALIMGWLAKDRDKRPADWGTAIQQLVRVLDGRHPTGAKEKPAPAGKRSVRTTRSVPRIKGKGGGKSTAAAAGKPAARGKTRRNARPVYPPSGGDNKAGIMIAAFAVFMFLVIILVAASK